MSNPQLEDGYLSIATELFDALIKVRMPGEARQMFDLIIRKTYGFHKKSDGISTSQIMEHTGLSHFGVYRARKTLKNMNLITIYKKAGSYFLIYSINKLYETWKVSTKKQSIYKKADGGAAKIAKKYLPKQDTQKIKDTIQKIVHFKKPSLEETTTYFKELLLPETEALCFYDYHEARGWILKGHKEQMKSWKAAARTWKYNYPKFSNDAPKNPIYAPRGVPSR